MKVNVYGLTEATISFNTIGMMLRGKYDPNPKKCDGCSYALNIEVENEAQASELRQVANYGLIRMEVIEEKPKEAEKVEEILTTEPPQEKPEEKPEEKAEEEKPKRKPKSRRGKSKSKKTEKKAEKEEKPKEKVVVMTDVGPKTQEMVHKMNGEIDENEPRCEASMKAAAKLDAEEAGEEVEEETPIDESLLDPSERMGTTAVIGAGNGKATQVEMKNNAFGDRPDANFLDVDEIFGDDVEDAFIDEEEPVDEDVENAFIPDEVDEEDQLGDAFIEV